MCPHVRVRRQGLLLSPPHPTPPQPTKQLWVGVLMCVRTWSWSVCADDADLCAEMIRGCVRRWSWFVCADDPSTPDKQGLNLVSFHWIFRKKVGPYHSDPPWGFCCSGRAACSTWNATHSDGKSAKVQRGSEEWPVSYKQIRCQAWCAHGMCRHLQYLSREAWWWSWCCLNIGTLRRHMHLPTERTSPRTMLG